MNQNQAIASIKKSCINSIDSSVGLLTNLLENLHIYRQSILDSFNLEAESINNDKNSTNTTTWQSHTLPGIISFPEIIKSESDKAQQVESNKEKLLQQKRLFFRFIENNYEHLLQSLKQLKYSDASYEEFLEINCGNINMALQPHKPDNRKSTVKPDSIKLTFDKDMKK